MLYAIEVPKQSTTSILVPASEIYILEDPGENFEFKDVVNHSGFRSAHSIQGPWFNDDINIFWVRIKIINNREGKSYIHEEFTTSLWDNMDTYATCDNKTYVSKSGVVVPISQRDVKSGDNILPLPDCKTLPYTLYIRLKRNVDPVSRISLSIDTYESFMQNYLHYNAFHAFFMGIIFIMTFYNIFVYLWLRDITFIYYILGNIFNGLLWISLTGFSTEHLWPESPLISKYLGNYISFLSLFFAVLFVRSYLRLKNKSRRLDYILALFQWIFLAHNILPLFFSWITITNIVSISTILFGITIITISIRLIMKGDKPAVFLILGWSALTSAMVIYAAGLLGIFPMNFYTYYSIEFGSVIETAFFSFGLGYRYNILEKESKSVQIKNKHLEYELEMARNIQMSLLPRNIPKHIAVLYEPMRSVGGDFYEIIEFGQDGKKGSTGFFISDVCGHGIPAALITVFMKNILSDEIKLLAAGNENTLLNNPAGLMVRLNNELHHNLQGGYITAIYGIIDFDKLVFKANGAAHPPPLILRETPDGTRILEFIKLTPQFPPIGTFEVSKPENNVCEVCEIALYENSYLILYSDGLMEAINYMYSEEIPGLAGFRHTLIYDLLNTIPFHHPEIFMEKLKAVITGNRTTLPLEDDICAVIVSL